MLGLAIICDVIAFSEALRKPWRVGDAGLGFPMTDGGGLEGKTRLMT